MMANEYDVDELLEWGYTSYELFGKGFDIETDIDYDEEWKGMPEFDNPDNPAVRNELFYDAAFKDITTEDGFWMCLRPGAASSVPEGLSGTDSETGGTYNLKGNIPVDPPIDGNRLCQNPADCSDGFSIH